MAYWWAYFGRNSERETERQQKERGENVEKKKRIESGVQKRGGRKKNRISKREERERKRDRREKEKEKQRTASVPSAMHCSALSWPSAVFPFFVFLFPRPLSFALFFL